MTFYDLQNAVKLLAANPQVHPNTPVYVETTSLAPRGNIEVRHVTEEPLVAARVESSPCQIVLSDSWSDLDVAR